MRLVFFVVTVLGVKQTHLQTKEKKMMGQQQTALVGSALRRLI
jgi:hypothetical protein